MVGLTYVPLFVRTSAALMRPSSPGRTRVTRPRGQRPRGEFLSTTITRSPVVRFRTSRCHFLRSVRDGTYSRSQRFQKWLVITWACFHLFLLLMSRSVTTSIGKLLLARPIKKWFGVNASSSCGSLLMCLSGRLFNSDSTSVKNVSRVSSVTLLLCCYSVQGFLRQLEQAFPSSTKVGRCWRVEVPLYPFLAELVFNLRLIPTLDGLTDLFICADKVSTAV